MAKNITSVTWSVVKDMPSGLSINKDTGVITGTPGVQPGPYTATIKVVTNYGTDTKTITINVAVPDSWKPVITPDQVVNAIADTAMTEGYTVKGTNVTKTA